MASIPCSIFMDFPQASFVKVVPYDNLSSSSTYFASRSASGSASAGRRLRSTFLGLSKRLRCLGCPSRLRTTVRPGGRSAAGGGARCWFKFGNRGVDAEGAGIYGSQKRDDFDRDDVEQSRTSVRVGPHRPIVRSPVAAPVSAHPRLLLSLQSLSAARRRRRRRHVCTPVCQLRRHSSLTVRCPMSLARSRPASARRALPLASARLRAAAAPPSACLHAGTPPSVRPRTPPSLAVRCPTLAVRRRPVLARRLYFNYMGMLAVEGTYDRMEALLNHNIHPVDILLMMAASEGDKPKIEELLRAGANYDVKDADGKTALDRAVNDEIKELILGFHVKNA